MTQHSEAELQAAHKTITSSIQKIEKVRKTLSSKHPQPKAQLTLVSRNHDALRLALSLIERELENKKG